MEKEKLIAIMNDDDINIDGTSVMFGLTMMVKYIPDFDISRVGHDTVFGADVDAMVTAGITEADALALRKQNWFIDEEFDCFASFV